jgi:hypothetical protein
MTMQAQDDRDIPGTVAYEAARALRAEMALDKIWAIVHTPTKATNYRSPDAHFQADFDGIRKIISDVRGKL